MAFYSYLSTKIIIMTFITKSYQNLFGVRSYINAINKKEWVVKMPIPFSHIFLMNYHVVPWNTLLSL